MAEQPRASTPAAAAAAAFGATVVVVLLATWAASIGPGDVFRGDGLTSQGEVGSASAEPTESVSNEPRPERTAAERDEQPVWVTVVGVLSQLVTVALLLYLVYRAVRWTRRLRIERRRRPPGPPDIPFDVLDAPERVVEAMVADAPAQRAALLEGAPRNSIVACWHRFETQASSVGLGREPWETSAEFTLRLLDLVSADAWAVDQLAVLYREARFSDHELGEVARRRAVAALDVLHRELLDRRVPSTGAGPDAAR